MRPPRALLLAPSAARCRWRARNRDPESGRGRRIAITLKGLTVREQVVGFRRANLWDRLGSLDLGESTAIALRAIVDSLDDSS
jgi:hypothetical protein